MKAVLFIAALLCYVLQGCSDLGGPIADGLPVLTETVDGKTLSYGTNQRFKLLLDSSIDAGYQWDYMLSDSTVASVEGEISYRSNNPGVPGGLATATVVFRTGRPGDCNISLFEHQRWLRDVTPRKTVTFRVLVQG